MCRILLVLENLGATSSKIPLLDVPSQKKAKQLSRYDDFSFLLLPVTSEGTTHVFRLPSFHSHRHLDGYNVLVHARERGLQLQINWTWSVRARGFEAVSTRKGSMPFECKQGQAANSLIT